MNVIHTWYLILFHPLSIMKLINQHSGLIWVSLLIVASLISFTQISYRYLSDYLIYYHVPNKYKAKTDMTAKDINNKYLQQSDLELYSLDENIFVTVGKVLVSHVIITIGSFGILLLAMFCYTSISQGIYHLYGHDSTLTLSLHLLPYAMLIFIIIASLGRNKPQWLRLTLTLLTLLTVSIIIVGIFI